MKRRHFLKNAGLATVASGAVSPWLQAEEGLAVRYAHADKKKVDIKLLQSEEEVMKMVSSCGGQVRAFTGGPVLAKLAGKSPAWSNLLVDCQNLTQLKQTLYRAGVVPLSTPELPAHFIKFRNGDQLFNVIVATIDHVCQRNHTILQSGIGIFAHHFLIFDPREKTLYDPHNAYDKGNESRITVFGRPYGVMRSLDCVLNAEFESLLLQLPLAENLRQLKTFVLEQQTKTAENRFVVERMLNYVPELIEMSGYEAASVWLRSKVVNRAFAAELKLDLMEIDKELERELKDGLAVDGAVFMARIDRKMGVKNWETDYGRGANHYMAANGFEVRRTDLLKKSLYLT